MSFRIFQSAQDKCSQLSHKSGRRIGDLRSDFSSCFCFKSGCGAKTEKFVVPHDHPANADAPQSRLRTLNDHDERRCGIASRRKMERHVPVSLSKASDDALTAALDAYFAIGDQLASDSLEHVNAKTREMLEAFHTFEDEVPAEWRESHKDHALAVQDYGKELGDISDIKAARVIYGSLSEVVNHLITLTGAPTSDGKPVYKYICGMASDVPQGGVWLQKGAPARNPYYGSSMLRCYSEQTQVSAAVTNEPSNEVPEHEHHMHQQADHNHHGEQMQPVKHNPVHEHTKERD